MRAERLSRVEECATAGFYLGEHAARHDVSRRKFSEGVPRQHEAFAFVVDQRGAFAAQGLGRKRRRIAPDHDRGGVKLHEFRIGDNCACACSDRETEPAGLRRICRHGIEMPDAAGRQYHRARRDAHRLCSGVAGSAQLKPCHRAIQGQKLFGEITFNHTDGGRSPHGFDQRRHDRPAGHVAAYMHDAPR